ncbi:MAG: hypothetical protein R3E61_06955 [Pseudomonadales bacterium]
MKIQPSILAAILIGTLAGSAFANDPAPATPATAQAPAAAPAATENLEQKIAEMQQSIDKLKADIQTIQTTRNELQAKLDQSDKDVAAQMKKIEEINTKIAEKQKAADAKAAEKKQ